MLVFLKILSESFILSIQQLWSNKLRSSLSLLSIAVGVFCIIVLQTGADSLKQNIEGSINRLGEDLVMVQKWPFFTGKDYPWWKYWQRPQPDIKDFKFLKSKSQTIDKVAYAVSVPDAEVGFEGRRIKGLDVLGATIDYNELVKFDIEFGRYFSQQESKSGYNVAIVGAEVATKLFDDRVDPIGKKIMIDNVKAEIIAVLKREGQDILGFNFDKVVLMPYALVNKSMSIDLESADPTIFIMPEPEIEVDEMMSEVSGLMRTVRRLRPKQLDDFSLVRFSIITNSFQGLYGILSIVQWVVGGLALLVGGFGIANIMFVSVSERTKIIGIKRAIGAKSVYILSEFLIESIILCVIGGVIGIMFLLLGLYLVRDLPGFEFIFSMNTVLTGIGVSALIGLLSGILPAIRAAKLDPVEAIRSK